MWLACIPTHLQSFQGNNMYKQRAAPSNEAGVTECKKRRTGAAEEELSDFVTSHQLANVEIVGFKSGEEKLEYVRNSMFTVVPSHFYETFGVVVLEAY